MEWSLFLDSEETIHSAERNDVTSYKLPSYFSLGFFFFFFNQNGRLHQFSISFFKDGLVLGLVDLIDVKCINVAQPMDCFIYILDSSNSSSITFWTSQFSSTSRSNWTRIWTGNSNGSWTDKQSFHFITVQQKGWL